MRILIVELATHASDLRFCVQSLFQIHQLTVFTSSETFERAKLKDFGGIRLVNSEVLSHDAAFSFYTWSERTSYPYLPLSQWEGLWTSHDHVIFVTEISNTSFLESLIRLGAPYSLFIHNAHSSLWKRPPIYLSFRALGSLFKKTFISTNHARDTHARHAKGLIFPSRLGAEHHAKTGDARVRFGYPWAICQGPSSKILTQGHKELESDESMLRLAVPGELDPRRRNFNILKSLIDSWKNARPLHIDFVGPVETKAGWRFLSQLKKQTTAGLRISGEGQWIPKSEFAKRLDAADAVLLNHAIQTRYGFVEETGGLTKVSGVLHDAIRHRKRVFVNEGYQISGELEGFVQKYERVEDLKKLLLTPIAPVPEVVWSSFTLAANRRRWTAYLDHLI